MSATGLGEIKLLTEILVTLEFSEEMWMPEVSMVDLVNLVRPDLTKDGGELRVRGDKTISLTYQIRVKIRCKLDLKLFPHDNQVISAMLEHWE